MKSIDVYANESSIHGIRYILSKNQQVSTRIIWIIAIILSVCGFSYYIYAASVKYMIEPEIVLKSNDRNAVDFPAPGITICSNLFAKDNLANLYFIFKNYVALNGTLNLSKSTCDYLAANLHWCQPVAAKSFMIMSCPNYTFSDLNVLELINKSALFTSTAFRGCANRECDREISRIFTDFGICFTRNTLSFSSIFNNKTIHDDFKCYKRMVNDTLEENSQWSPEKGFWPVNNTYPLRAGFPLQVGM
jgi:Amiloride-sensitive sodium channel